MEEGCSLVLDVGKTNAKISLWSAAGDCLARRARANEARPQVGYRPLDIWGLEAWVKTTLREFTRLGAIRVIAPVTHGAAAVLVRQGRLPAAPMDYEAEIPNAICARYDSERDPFADTGSPRLPKGLNLGVQLAWLEELLGPWPNDLRILLWPQYWAWRFSGVMASEVSSLGCHTDLWRPGESRFSDLAISRGWANRFPPRRRAAEVLGPITPEWVADTGLSADCQVICGLHDSNAALLAARGHPEIAAADATIVSTGTWFVAMRSPGADGSARPDLSEARDCLINVDVEGRPSPSARFMGGRESELIAGLDSHHIPDNYDPAPVLDAAPRLIEHGAMALPTFATGFGPFPRLKGRWENEPGDATERRAALGLYLALMTDVSLDLVGTRNVILVEGRFAEAQVFIRALAALRPNARVFVSNAHDDVPFGALRLINPELRPKSALTPVTPLDTSLDSYRAAWRARIAGAVG